jgi:hypothetical protein
MTKTVQKDVTRVLREKRKQLTSIRAEIEDLLDFVDLLEARAKDAGKPRLSHEEMKKRFS